MPKSIVVTEDLMNSIYESQKTRLIEVLNSNRNGDDGGDYITSALDCFSVIQLATCDQTDTATIDRWLNTPPDYNMIFLPHTTVVPLCNCASDGVCDFLLNLNCPALPKEG